MRTLGTLKNKDGDEITVVIDCELRLIWLVVSNKGTSKEAAVSFSLFESLAIAERLQRAASLALDEVFPEKREKSEPEPEPVQTGGYL